MPISQEVQASTAAAAAAAAAQQSVYISNNDSSTSTNANNNNDDHDQADELAVVPQMSKNNDNNKNNTTNNNNNKPSSSSSSQSIISQPSTESAIIQLPVQTQIINDSMSTAVSSLSHNNDADENNNNESIGFDLDNPHFYTKDELERINNIEAQCKKNLSIGRDAPHYENAMALKDVINNTIGEHYGFKVSLSGGSSIKCMNADAPSHEEKRTAKRQASIPTFSRRERKKKRCGCEFGINFSRTNRQDKDDKSVFITKASFRHTKGCRPSSQQLLQQHVTSGTFSRKGASQRSINTLLDMMRYEDHVESKTVRNILKEVLPEAAPVNAALIANVRTRAKKMLNAMERDKLGKLKNAPTISVEDADDLIQQSLDDAASGKLCGMELTNPEFVGLATQELKIILREALEKGKELDQIISLLTQSRARDPAFDFRVAKNKRGKIVGILWQDGMMRGHCQGGLLDVVMLDMMKRQQNSADWPYCGPILITGENKIACACEAIVLSEGTSYYSWIMNSVYDMSGVDRSVTKIIFGDGIHSDNLLRQLNIEDTCNLIFDRYHLMEVDWKKKFGYAWPALSSYMHTLVHAKTEESYTHALEEVRKRVKSTELQNYVLNEVHANRKHIVDYWIKNYPLHLNRLGDQGAESNHSSYCARISFGGFVQPAEQVFQCLERSKDIAKELNIKRWESWTEALQDAQTMRQNNDIENCMALLKLSPEGLRLWNDSKEESEFYSTRPSTEYPGCNEVYRSDEQQSPPRILGPGMVCGCEKAVAFGSLCPHQYCQDEGKFILDRFPKRYHRLNGIQNAKRVNESSSMIVSYLDDNMLPLESPTNTNNSTSHGSSETEDKIASLQDDMDNGAKMASNNIGGQLGQVEGEQNNTSNKTRSHEQLSVPAVATNKKRKKEKKMSYNEAMKHLQPLAEMLASHKHQKVILGGINGLVEIVRSGQLDTKEKFTDRMEEHCEQFSNYNVDGYLMATSQPTSDDTTNSGVGVVSSLGDMTRRNAGGNSHKPRTSRIKPGSEAASAAPSTSKQGGKTVDEKFCSVCDEKGHIKGAKCSVWSQYAKFVCNKDEVLALTSRLGEPSIHDFIQCPSVIEQEIKAREHSEASSQPWPIKAKHCVLTDAYFDCDVPHIGTRFAPDRRVGNNLNNIVAVQYLEKNGGDVYKDPYCGNRSTYYYRVRDVQDIISNNIKGKNLLFNKLKKKSM